MFLQIECAAAAWDPSAKCHTSNLEVLQNQAIRFEFAARRDWESLLQHIRHQQQRLGLPIKSSHTWVGIDNAMVVSATKGSGFEPHQCQLPKMVIYRRTLPDLITMHITGGLMYLFKIERASQVRNPQDVEVSIEQRILLLRHALEHSYIDEPQCIVATAQH